MFMPASTLLVTGIGNSYAVDRHVALNPGWPFWSNELPEQDDKRLAGSHVATDMAAGT
jgi:hypothetical protein